MLRDTAGGGGDQRSNSCSRVMDFSKLLSYFNLHTDERLTQIYYEFDLLSSYIHHQLIGVRGIHIREERLNRCTEQGVCNKFMQMFCVGPNLVTQFNLGSL